MAPEVWNHETDDERIDIWSLGICTFCMISCRHPFEVPDLCCETFRQFKDDNSKIFDIFQNCSSNPLSYSPKLFQLLEFMLTFEKDLRIWSGKHFYKRSLTCRFRSNVFVFLFRKIHIAEKFCQTKFRLKPWVV